MVQASTIQKTPPPVLSETGDSEATNDLNPRKYGVFQRCLFPALLKNYTIVSTQRFEEEITPASDPDPWRPGSRCVAWPMPFKAGKCYMLEMNQKPGTGVDPYLRVVAKFGERLGDLRFSDGSQTPEAALLPARRPFEDDNSGGGLNAKLVFMNLPKDYTLNVMTTTAGPNQFGKFEFVVSEIIIPADGFGWSGTFAMPFGTPSPSFLPAVGPAPVVSSTQAYAPPPPPGNPAAMPLNTSLPPPPPNWTGPDLTGVWKGYYTDSMQGGWSVQEFTITHDRLRPATLHVISHTEMPGKPAFHCEGPAVLDQRANTVQITELGSPNAVPQAYYLTLIGDSTLKGNWFFADPAMAAILPDTGTIEVHRISGGPSRSKTSPPSVAASTATRAEKSSAQPDQAKTKTNAPSAGTHPAAPAKGTKDPTPATVSGTLASGPKSVSVPEPAPGTSAKGNPATSPAKPAPGSTGQGSQPKIPALSPTSPRGAGTPASTVPPRGSPAPGGSAPSARSPAITPPPPPPAGGKPANPPKTNPLPRDKSSGSS